MADDVFKVISFVLITAVAALAVIIFRAEKKQREATAETERLYDLIRAFFNSKNSMFYLKDERLNYFYISKQYRKFIGKRYSNILGFSDYNLFPKQIADKIKKTDLAALEKNTLITEKLELDGSIYEFNKFPYKLENGSIGLASYVKDITKQLEDEKKREQEAYRHKILADMLNKTFASRREQLDYVLHESLKITQSKYGYIFLFDEEKHRFMLNSWTSGVLEDCKLPDKKDVCQLEETGLWGEVVRQRKPLIVNDYKAPNSLKKGYPKGHVEIKRFMSIPVILDEKIVAVVGMANKESDYNDNDLFEITVLMSSVWLAVDRRNTHDRMIFERNKYLQILFSIGDGVMVVNKQGSVEMLNKAAEKLTGWKQNEAHGKDYKEVFASVKDKPTENLFDPIEAILSGEIIEFEGESILKSKDGTQYYIEDNASAMHEDASGIAGVVLVFRDITEKKNQQDRIEYLSFHDPMTGLYNRRFLEEEMKRLDTKRNLPISIISGDVDGLKLTNDVFGHLTGDELIQKVADIMRRVCRADDITARWGGDEFLIFLPKTSLEQAEGIMKRIASEFENERIKAVKGRISLGAASKTSEEESILDVIVRAEEKMYSSKLQEKRNKNNIIVEDIINTLHRTCKREKEHSEKVSQMCWEIGSELKLPEKELHKLKQAGYYHDIGKIALDAILLNKSNGITEKEYNETKRHPIVGYRILNTFDKTADIAEPVLLHQERWDGTGYPKGLKGEEIPLVSRIISAAELYDRIIYNADSTNSKSKQEASKMIKDFSGSMLDPAIVEALLNVINKTEDKAS